jgi:penicillin amidase/acyl-homoserine-lactone acylase
MVEPRRPRRRALRWIGAVALLALALFAFRRVRRALFPKPAPPDAATLAHVARVRILRDVWGVPHVFGKSDADAAFGLAYADAEDDWPTMQGVLAAARGQLSLLLLSEQAVSNDYYVSLVRVADQVDAEYDALAPDTRAVLEGYARGINYYAWKHPAEVDGRLLPVRGRDIAAGFAHKIPLMLGIDRTLKALGGKEDKRVGDEVIAAHPIAEGEWSEVATGSNVHALAAPRSPDGVTRLNVNSHQPWEGPVTWYEAQVVSEEGWNMTGATFPGAPVILHGHNEHLGWGLTVNAPDLIDVYRLETDPAHPDAYRYDGTWRPLEVREAPLAVDVGVATLTFHKKVYSSVHGPVFATDHGLFAIRYAGMGRAVGAVEQWYRMNKARSLEEWLSAMRLQHIPMFNAGYADAGDVFYVYNALLPVRREGFDYTRVLPGDRSDLVWSTYLPFDALPQVKNPASGFIQNCNATPFRTTTGDDNPLPSRFSPTAGIDTYVNNRTLRSLSLFGGEGSVGRDDFLRFKFDRVYDREGPMFTDAIEPVLARLSPADDAERRGLELFRRWDGATQPESLEAALAILTFQPIARGHAGPKGDDALRSFRAAVAFLMQHYGTLEVPLGTVQRLHRGAVDLPLGGGPDVIAAVHTRIENDKLVGYQGDSYVLIVDFAKDRTTSAAISQYGASDRPGSRHYADQAPLFVQQKLRPSLRTEAEIRAHLEREYHPGEEAR